MGRGPLPAAVPGPPGRRARQGLRHPQGRELQGGPGALHRGGRGLPPLQGDRAAHRMLAAGWRQLGAGRSHLLADPRADDDRAAHHACTFDHGEEDDLGAHHGEDDDLAAQHGDDDRAAQHDDGGEQLVDAPHAPHVDAVEAPHAGERGSDGGGAVAAAVSRRPQMASGHCACGHSSAVRSARAARDAVRLTGRPPGCRATRPRACWR
mmetsp:Transcript_9795/g.28960  ORF Transcript_9795/g.28960 Transcript_9795/m.28960 type:complete len:208 (-) Transcript_9795:904-1527(-)